MRITVEIDEKALKRVKKVTHIAKSSPAISFVVDEWLRQIEKKAFLDDIMSGRTDYSMTNEELERRIYGTD